MSRPPFEAGAAQPEEPHGLSDSPPTLMDYAAALWALQEATRRLDQVTDDLQVALLRRAHAIRLLEAVIPDVPPWVASKIRTACDALLKGGEEADGMTAAESGPERGQSTTECEIYRRPVAARSHWPYRVLAVVTVAVIAPMYVLDELVCAARGTYWRWLTRQVDDDVAVLEGLEAAMRAGGDRRGADVLTTAVGWLTAITFWTLYPLRRLRRRDTRWS